MNEVLQAILDYVQTPQTDYALLITGPWGCGKTYFWRHVITPMLRGLRHPHRPRRLLYTSLYGVSDAQDIDRSLFVQSYPGLNRKKVGRVSRLATGVLEALGFADLTKIDLRSLVQAKDAVICFDDLERTGLGMKEALGYINSFVEHEGAKAIVLCNEKLIGDEQDRDAYEKMKEKVVGSSLTFRPDHREALQSLVAEHKDKPAFSEFLLQHQELIGQLFEKSETHNIRTLRRILAALRTVFGALKKVGIDPNAVATQVIYSVATTSLELHAGKANAETLRRLHALSMLAIAAIGRGDEDEIESYEQGFVKRYIPDAGWNEIIGCPAICEFVITGFLDRAELLRWAKELVRVPDARQERIRRLATHDVRAMEDEEFTQISAQVLQDVETGEITAVGDYDGLYGRFEWFDAPTDIGEVHRGGGESRGS